MLIETIYTAIYEKFCADVIYAAMAWLPEEAGELKLLDEADALVDGDEETGETDLNTALEEAMA